MTLIPLPTPPKADACLVEKCHSINEHAVCITQVTQLLKEAVTKLRGLDLSLLTHDSSLPLFPRRQ